MGTPVFIYGSTDRPLAVSVLGPGTEPSSGVCEFAFTVAGVPVGKGPYFIKVAFSEKIAFDQTAAANLPLTIGDGSCCAGWVT